MTHARKVFVSSDSPMLYCVVLLLSLWEQSSPFLFFLSSTEMQRAATMLRANSSQTLRVVVFVALLTVRWKKRSELSVTPDNAPLQPWEKQTRPRRTDAARALLTSTAPENMKERTAAGIYGTYFLFLACILT